MVPRLTGSTPMAKVPLLAWLALSIFWPMPALTEAGVISSKTPGAARLLQSLTFIGGAPPLVRLPLLPPSSEGVPPLAEPPAFPPEGESADGELWPHATTQQTKPAAQHERRIRS